MSDLQQRLRRAADTLRRTSMPLADLIPLLQQAADALEEQPARAVPLLTEAQVLALRSENGWSKETIRAIEQAVRSKLGAGVANGAALTHEEIASLRHNLSAAIVFCRGNVRDEVLDRFDRWFEHVKDLPPQRKPDPEAMAEGLAQIIFEAINPGKVWTYQSTDTRNAYWQAGQAAKEFLK